ncbi:MAG TPA: hypothetical protein VE821_02350, partial [Pyrinomonadaceae bacterium]|nr:hypothetical protein [Pyrinomonadaceae bacterium]
MNRKSSTLFAALLLLLLFSSAHAQRGMTPADTLRVATVADAQVSPDGERIVYTVTTIEGNESRTHLWLVRRGWRVNEPVRVGEPPAPLLPAGWIGSTPRWSPDGRRIAFLSTREGQTGLYVVNAIPNSTPRQVAPVRETNFFITYADEPLAWSPDSHHIAYISASAPDGIAPILMSEKQRPDPLVVDRIQYKSRTSFSDNLRTHVWLTDVDEPNPHPLTSGPYYDHALTFSPRGDEIAFLSNHEQDPDANNNSDIFTVTTDGRMRQLTTTRGCEYQPAWSPDGKWLAYTATKRDVTTIDSVAEDTHVWIISTDGSSAGRELTAALDRRAQHPHWSADSSAIFFLAGNRGQTFIYRARLDGGVPVPFFTASDMLKRNEEKTPPELLRPYQITSFSVSNTSASNSYAGFAFTRSDALRPAEV